MNFLTLILIVSLFSTSIFGFSIREYNPPNPESGAKIISIILSILIIIVSQSINSDEPDNYYSETDKQTIQK